MTRTHAITAALVALALTLVFAPPVGASTHATSRPAETVAVLDARQASVLRAGAVRVRVRVTHAVQPRVSASSGGDPVARSQHVRFHGAGVRTVRLRLTRAGRSALASCARRTLTARAGHAFQRVTFQRDPKHCPGTHDPAPTVVAASPGSGRPGDAVPAGGAAGPGTSGERTGELKGYDPADGCDPLDPAVCLYPWPNDEFTTADASTDTGRKLDLNLLAMPRNIANKPIDPTDENRNDGFSPGNLIVTKIPGLDTPKAFAANHLVPITDMARYADPRQAMVVIDTATHRRWPIFTELDANPKSAKDVTLIARPTVNFTEGHRYVVALRHLVDDSGRPIAARDAFRFYRDRITTKPRVDSFEARRPRMERIFADLSRAGISRDDLYLAWDFTVASRRSLSERILQIRNDAYAKLGDSNLSDLTVQGIAPKFVVNPDLPDDLPTVPCGGVPNPPAPVPVGCGDIPNTHEIDGIRNFKPCSAGGPAKCEDGESDTLARRVQGQVVVPCYLNLPGCPPGAQFAYTSASATTPTAIPGNTALANFICDIPRSAVEGADGKPKVSPARPSLYGHGLLGSAGEVGAGNVQTMGQNYDMVFCATDWAGMSTTDIPNVATLLVDLSRFSTLTDRVQQGLVNFMMLGRDMIAPDGFSSSQAFRFPDSDGTLKPVIDTARLFYDSNSQGAIIGGALAAVEPDFNRAVLGVPGMNYSTLLRRSTDFSTYAQILYNAYPDELQRPLILSMIQLLWDRAEANGYAEHMTTAPYANTPQHTILLNQAVGDHQVANVAAEVEARTIGAATMPNPILRFRSLDVSPLWDIRRIAAFPYSGSAIVPWDIGPPVRDASGKVVRGTPPPPVMNTPQSRDFQDPHESPRRTAAAQAQKSAFLQVGGTLIDTCGGRPCFADGYDGSGG